MHLNYIALFGAILLSSSCVTRYSHDKIHGGTLKFKDFDVSLTGATSGSGAKTGPPWGLRCTVGAKMNFIRKVEIRILSPTQFRNVLRPHDKIEVVLDGHVFGQTTTLRTINPTLIAEAGVLVRVEIKVYCVDGTFSFKQGIIRLKRKKDAGHVRVNPLFDYT